METFENRVKVGLDPNLSASHPEADILTHSGSYWIEITHRTIWRSWDAFRKLAVCDGLVQFLKYRPVDPHKSRSHPSLGKDVVIVMGTKSIVFQILVLPESKFC